MRVLSIGEILWDVFPNQELLGGAALNFSVNISRLGDSASLVTGLGKDVRGRTAYDAMKSLSMPTDFVQSVDHWATGIATVSTTAEGEPHFEIPRPAAFDAVIITPEIVDKAMRWKPDWLYFGTLLQTEPNIERGTHHLNRALPGVRCFYDMNLRHGHWTVPLIQRLCKLASVLKLNEVEAKLLGEVNGIPADTFTLQAFCKATAEQYELDAICITLGAAGCCVYEEDSFHSVPGYPVVVHDSVGAGDAFSAAFLHGYHRGWAIERAARFANGLGSIVASRAGATPHWSMQECFQLTSLSAENSERDHF
jgi:fructokinase